MFSSLFWSLFDVAILLQLLQSYRDASQNKGYSVESIKVIGFAPGSLVVMYTVTVSYDEEDGYDDVAEVVEVSQKFN